jgi:large subunit ribosomal protein L28
MSKICAICGKKPVAGRTITRRGLAKKKGGVGLKITGVNPRRFLPNLQTVRAVVKGTPMRIRVCVKCLKAGKVVKAA